MVVIASSRGGVPLLLELVPQLPADFPAAVVLVQHLDARVPSSLAELLSVHSVLPVQVPRSGCPVQPGTIYVAYPGEHLLLDGGGCFQSSDGVKVQYVRPSADVLFESVAGVYGPRALAIVLTGSGHDGTAGLSAIKAGGGVTIAQNEATSDCFAMPQSAIDSGDVDYILSQNEIVPRLLQLVQPTRAET